MQKGGPCVYLRKGPKFFIQFSKESVTKGLRISWMLMSVFSSGNILIPEPFKLSVKQNKILKNQHNFARNSRSSSDNAAPPRCWNHGLYDLLFQTRKQGFLLKLPWTPLSGTTVSGYGSGHSYVLFSQSPFFCFCTRTEDFDLQIWGHVSWTLGMRRQHSVGVWASEEWPWSVSQETWILIQLWHLVASSL